MSLKITGEIIKLKAFSICESDVFKIKKTDDLKGRILFDKVFYNKNKLKFSSSFKNINFNENMFFSKDAYKENEFEENIILEKNDFFYENITNEQEGYICYLLEYYDFHSSQNILFKKNINITNMEVKTCDFSYITADILNESIFYDLKIKGKEFLFEKNNFFNSFDLTIKRKLMAIVLNENGDYFLEKRIDFILP